jgi:hypothetical protein
MAEKFCPGLGLGKQSAKTGFGLEKYKENEPNYQCLPLLTVLPINYFRGLTKPTLASQFEQSVNTFSMVE